MTKTVGFIKEIFSSRLTIFLVVLNLSYFLYGESPAGLYAHQHTSDCLVTIHPERYFFGCCYTMVDCFFRLLNLPAYLLSICLISLIGNYFPQVCFLISDIINEAIGSFFIGLQWLLISAAILKTFKKPVA